MERRMLTFDLNQRNRVSIRQYAMTKKTISTATKLMKFFQRHRLTSIETEDSTTNKIGSLCQYVSTLVFTLRKFK